MRRRTLTTGVSWKAQDQAWVAEAQNEQKACRREESHGGVCVDGRMCFGGAVSIFVPGCFYSLTSGVSWVPPQGCNVRRSGCNVTIRILSSDRVSIWGWGCRRASTQLAADRLVPAGSAAVHRGRGEEPSSDRAPCGLSADGSVALAGRLRGRPICASCAPSTPVRVSGGYLFRAK